MPIWPMGYEVDGHQIAPSTLQLQPPRNLLPVHVLLLMAFALLLNREATWVPGGNEQIYFLYLFKAWHPAFLAHDWTVAGEPTAGHAVFNFVFGWPTLWIPLAVYGWIGRFASWAVLLTALLRLGRHFRLSAGWAATGVLLWLIQRQSFVANEWIIGTFEAKCVAYACLLFSLDCVLSDHDLLAAALVGLTFSFHSAVGLWGGGAVFIAYAVQSSIPRTLRFAAVAAVCALPGLVTSYQLVAGGHSITPEQARFLVLSEMPFHLDPLTFGASRIAVLGLMLAFDALHSWKNRDDRALRFLGCFEISLAAFFAVGIIARLLKWFTFVQLFPFRVFAVMVMLLFFWHLIAAWQRRQQRPPGVLLAGLGMVAFLSLPSFGARLATLITYDAPRWRHQQDDFRTAACWVRDHVPADQIVIAPPWRKDAFYFTQHPLVACWDAPRFNDMTAWRQRVESLVGDTSHLDVEQNRAGDMDDAAQAHYQNLTPAQIESIRHRYGGDVLITQSAYPYPLLFATPTYKVFSIRP